MKTIKKILFILLLIIFSLLVIYNIVIMYKTKINSNKTPDVFGYKTFIVLSNSMIPTFNIDDLVVSKIVDEEEIKVNDIISFHDDENIVTHRVVDIENSNGEKHYITKGDNNNTNDENYVLYEDIEGKLIYKVPKAGKILALFNSKLSLIMLMILIFIISLYNHVKN